MELKAIQVNGIGFQSAVAVGWITEVVMVAVKAEMEIECLNTEAIVEWVWTGMGLAIDLRPQDQQSRYKTGGCKKGSIA